ncbi:MAG: plastocyanin [Chlamydiales bacterium]|jgi:plastocyanin
MKTLNRLGLAAAIVLPATIAMAGGSTTTTPKATGTTAVTGIITGKIDYDGEAPKVKQLTVSDEQGKGCCADSDGASCIDAGDRSILVDAAGGIANVVVSVRTDTLPDPLGEPIKLDQSKCRFEPHIIVIPVGSSVSYINSDGVSHNIHTYARKNDGLNKTVSAGTALSQTFDQKESVKVTCDIHPWMTSWIYVTDSPYYAVTGADGTFEIPGLEPGTYDVDIWHETLGKSNGEVTIAADGSSPMLSAKLGGTTTTKKKRRR